MTAHVWTTLMPGVYAPVFLDCAPLPAEPATRPSRRRPAWFPKHIIRRPMRRYRLIDASRLPY